MHKGPTLKDRLILYPAIAVLFLFLCYIVALSAWGYRFYLEDGKIIKKETGIVIVTTKPGSAEIYLDGKRQKKNTPAFSFLSTTIKGVPVGEHQLRVVKNGYETWEKKINVESGLVAWSNYLVLIPQKRTASNYSFPGTVVQTSSSPDKNHLFVLAEDQSQQLRTVWEVSPQNKERVKILEEKIVPGKTLSLLSSSFDGNRILVSRVEESIGKYYVVENSLGGRSWNIADLYGMTFNDLKFSPDNNAELYGLKGSDLYTIDYESKKMSAVVASHVVRFYPEVSGVFAIQVADGNHGLYKINKNGSENNVIKSIPASEDYQFEYLDKNGGYLILPTGTGETLYFNDDKSGKMTSKILGSKQSWFAVSPAEENVALYGDKKLVVYSFEKDESYSVISDKSIDSLSWFNDQSNLVYSSDSKINLVNFDGFYNKFLFDAAEKSSVFAVATSANIYFITKNNDLKDLSVFSFDF
jgi:hypothetical protein